MTSKSGGNFESRRGLGIVSGIRNERKKNLEVQCVRLWGLRDRRIIRKEEKKI